MAKTTTAVPAAPVAGRFPRLLMGENRRLAVLLRENERYKVLLRVADNGAVDVDRLDNAKFAAARFVERPEPYGPWRFANTFARSELFKTVSAARAIEEIRLDQANAVEGMTMQQLVDEYKRLTGREVKSFKSKAAGMAAIEKASKLKNAEASVAASATPEGAGNATKTTEESEMRAATSTTAKGKAKGKTAKVTKERAAGAAKQRAAAKQPKQKKAPAAPRGKGKGKVAANGKARAENGAKRGGIGALARELIGKGKSNEEIVDAILEKFPGARTNSANISWYRSNMGK